MGMSLVQGRVHVVLTLFSISILSFCLSPIASAEEIPEEVFIAQQAAQRDWLEIVKKIRDLEDINKNTPNISQFESSPFLPFKVHVISYDNILKCKSSRDILSHIKLYGYRAPMFFENIIEGFATIKYSMDYEQGVVRWHYTGFGQGAEREKEYYSLLNEYPEGEGYKIYIISFEVASNMFFVVKTPEDEFTCSPASQTSLGFLHNIAKLNVGFEFIPMDQVLPAMKHIASLRSAK